MSKDKKKKVATIYDAYAIDLNKEVDGVEEELDYLPGNYVTIARFGNPASSKLMRRLYKPYAKSQRAGRDIPDEIQEKILNEVIATTIWLGWRGPAFVGHEEGTDRMVPLQHSRTNVLTLLNDPVLTLLRDEIVEKSRAGDLFKAVQDEEAKENLDLS